MKLFFRRSLCILAGFAAAFVILEAALSAVGLFFREQPPATLMARARDADFVVLCLGDSRTYGIGAAEGESYPDQLQKKLAALVKDHKVAVINQGFPKDNTWQMLHKLKRWARTDRRPDLVLLLGGQSNFWNFKGFTGENASLPARVFGRLRTPRFFRHLKNRLCGTERANRKRKTALAAAPVFGLALDEDMAIIRQSIAAGTKLDIPEAAAVTPPDEGFWMERAAAFLDRRKTNEIIACMSKAIALLEAGADSDKEYLANIYQQLGAAYSWAGDFDRACLCFLRALENDRLAECQYGLSMALLQKSMLGPAVRSGLRHLCLSPRNSLPLTGLLLWRLRAQAPMIKKLVQDFDLPVFPGMRLILESDNQMEAVIGWMTADLQKMIDLSKNWGADVFLIDDINHQFAEPWIYKRLAEKNDIVRIRTKALLSARLMQNSAPLNIAIKDFLAGDRDHPNSRGYGFMADCIVDEIVKAGLHKK